MSFSLPQARRVQSNPGELGQVGRPAMVRDSGSKHENSGTSGGWFGELAGRSGCGVSAQLARNWFQPRGRGGWFHGESARAAQGNFQTPCNRPSNRQYRFIGTVRFQVGRITGLDAAYPLYMNTGSEGHLAKSDAMFVDVIHTDGGNFGFPNPLGHVDFYPNGGKPVQPGCNLENVFRRSLSRLINQYSTNPSYLPTLSTTRVPR